MTKKDYEAIAAAINAPLVISARHLTGRPDPAYLSVSRIIAEGIATHAAKRDKKFKRERFLRACGVLP